MASQGSQTSASYGVGRREEARAAANQSLTLLAEQELLRAIGTSRLLLLGMHSPPSHTEAAALDRAVHAICREAHRLDLQAEELLIAIKQAWAQLATTRRTNLGERDGDVLRDIVSSSIEVFFDSRQYP